MIDSVKSVSLICTQVSRVDSEVFPSPFGGAPNKDILTFVKGRFSVVSGYRRGTRKMPIQAPSISIVPAGPHARSLTQEALEL